MKQLKTRILILISIFLNLVLNSQTKDDNQIFDFWLKGSLNDLNYEYFKDSKNLNFNLPINIEKLENSSVGFKSFDANYTLFIVFSSQDKEEKTILTSRIGNHKIKISNFKIENNKNELLHQYQSNNGIILDIAEIINDKNSFKLLSLSKDESLVNTNIYELIYLPKSLNEAEHQKLESYLSIKYGISLLGNKNYYNSNNFKIWDSEKNKNFNNRVTGISIDKALGLAQKQSGNSIKDGLYIGFGDKQDSLNLLNKTEVQDFTSLIWGDNGKSIQFQTVDHGYSKMSRVWRMQLSSLTNDSIETNFKINKKEFGISDINNDSKYWLLIDNSEDDNFNYENAKYYPHDISNETDIIFNSIFINNASNKNMKFTFIKSATFLVDKIEYSNLCNTEILGELEFKIKGAKLPVTVKTYKNDIVIKTDIFNSDSFSMNNIEYNVNYKFEFKDSNEKVYECDYMIENNKKIDSKIEPIWFIEDKNIEIFLTETDSIIGYKWFYKNHLISEEARLITSLDGEYSVEIQDVDGCTKNLFFNVYKIERENKWSIYPNPIKSGEFLNFKFDFENESDIKIKIMDSSNKLLFVTQLKDVKSKNFNYKVTNPGIYLVELNINNNIETVKLIVE